MLKYIKGEEIMNKIFKNCMLSFSAITLLVGCGGNKVDVLSYQLK